MESLLREIEGNFELLLFFVLVFSFGLAIVEFIWEIATRKMNVARLKEMGTSFFVAVPSTVVEAFAEGAILALYLGLYQWVSWKIPVSWWTLGIVLVLADFIHYWTHRWEHKVRFFWAFHSVHHSSPVYNYSTAFRVVFIRTVFDTLYYLPLVILGFHPILIFLSLTMVGFYQIWLHTELIGKLGIFEKFMCTPSHHRVHHGSDTKYIDKNYAGIFIIWDKMFGTFQVEEERPTYGLTKPLDSVNPLRVHFHEYIKIFKDLKQTRSWKEGIGYLIAPPGWTPSPKTETSITKGEVQT